MIYLSLDQNIIKLLQLKKSILGQYEVNYFEKKHETDLLQKGSIINMDLVASAIKEALTLAVPNPVKEKEVCLILPADTFQFLRIEIPTDIAQTAINSFLRDKIRVTFPANVDNSFNNYIVKENNKHREILFYSINKDILRKFQESLSLLDLKLANILPSTLAYFKLFEKTLRKDKKENIFYVHHSKDYLMGYLYDSFGLIINECWFKELTSSATLEETLKKKNKEFESKGIKLNRLILSGKESEKIRQDTFTKIIGVWTNLLKRIIPDFYQEYLKLIITPKNQTLPFLALDECFGAFIFNIEEKKFSLLNKNILSDKKFDLPRPNIKLPVKEFLIFIISFISSFIVLSLISKQNIKINLGSLQQINNKNTTIASNKPSITPTSTPKPTPSIAKDKIKIKILNGSGIAGRANSAKELLKNDGYQEILTGNADSFDYKVTELQVKKSKSEMTNVIKKDLDKYADSIKVGELDENNNADVIIIVGENFK